MLSSAKSGSSHHPSASLARAAPRHQDEEGKTNTIPPTRAQTAKGIARVFEYFTEKDSPLQRPRTQKHVPNGTRSLHEAEASPGARSTQGAHHGGKGPSRPRRYVDGGKTSKKQPKPNARKAQQYLGDGEGGDVELLLEADRKGKPKKTVLDEKEIEGSLADVSSEEESIKKEKTCKSKSEKSKGPKEKVGCVCIV